MTFEEIVSRKVDENWKRFKCTTNTCVCKEATKLHVNTATLSPPSMIKRTFGSRHKSNFLVACWCFWHALQYHVSSGLSTSSCVYKVKHSWRFIVSLSAANFWWNDSSSTMTY